MVSGTGSLTQAGTGTTVLTADNTYTGGTTISAGTLQLGSGGATGSITGDIADQGTLILNRANTLMLAGAITGSGSLTQAGSGTSILTGASTYSGNTEIAAGVLAIGDAQHANAALSGGGVVSVAVSAALAGYGSIAGSVTNHGIISVANALPLFNQDNTGSLMINGALNNAGTAQLAGSAVGNVLQVNQYVGQNGVITLNAVLDQTGSPADRLVVNGGTASGTSTLFVNNKSGTGTLINGNGIEVVRTLNGATTQTQAFTLGGPVSAGPYAYYLAKGGVTSGTDENWYLRNILLPATTPITIPTPSGPVVLPSPATPLPLYRDEVPLFSAIAGTVNQVGIEQISNFHSRHGDQSLLTENSALPASWGRTWGGTLIEQQRGTVAPEFSGAMGGFQVGQDIFARTDTVGRRHHYGVIAGVTHASGDISGFAYGIENRAVGRLALNSYSVGGYWTQLDPAGWYTDAVLLGSLFTANINPYGGAGKRVRGSSMAASIEAGRPVTIAPHLTIEPQIQLAWQRIAMNSLNDGVTQVSFDDSNNFIARIGVKLNSQFDWRSIVWQPYARVNVVAQWGPANTTLFGTTAIDHSVDQTGARIDMGLSAQTSKFSNVLINLSYATSLNATHQRVLTGNVGLQWCW